MAFATWKHVFVAGIGLTVTGAALLGVILSNAREKQRAFRERNIDPIFPGLRNPESAVNANDFESAADIELQDDKFLAALCKQTAIVFVVGSGVSANMTSVVAAEMEYPCEQYCRQNVRVGIDVAEGELWEKLKAEAGNWTEAATWKRFLVRMAILLEEYFSIDVSTTAPGSKSMVTRFHDAISLDMLEEASRVLEEITSKSKFASMRAMRQIISAWHSRNTSLADALKQFSADDVQALMFTTNYDFLLEEAFASAEAKELEHKKQQEKNSKKNAEATADQAPVQSAAAGPASSHVSVPPTRPSSAESIATHRLVQESIERENEELRRDLKERKEYTRQRTPLLFSHKNVYHLHGFWTDFDERNGFTLFPIDYQRGECVDSFVHVCTQTAYDMNRHFIFIGAEGTIQDHHFAEAWQEIGRRAVAEGKRPVFHVALVRYEQCPGQPDNGESLVEKLHPHLTDEMATAFSARMLSVPSGFIVRRRCEDIWRMHRVLILPIVYGCRYSDLESFLIRLRNKEGFIQRPAARGEQLARRVQ